MRIEQLEYAAAVARAGSFRRAAESLNLSQPALSTTVRKLERELGVEILERHASGATISESGRELLPYMLQAIETIDELRRVADGQRRVTRVVSVGTVTVATASLVTPTIRAFREAYPDTEVEIVSTHQAQIHRSLLDGSLDLGLVNYLEDDDLSPEFEHRELLRGRPVVCIHPSSPLASRPAISRAELRGQPLITMRNGYVMRRYLHRLFPGRPPHLSYSTDGADMAKVMVATGLGAAVLPIFSIAGDPLEERGEITYREIEDDDTEVFLVVQRRRDAASTRAVQDLVDLFVERSDSITVR
ncbi:MAG: LysR family transcriptional regulator [Actinobacteria bacterium]|nr:LysR family transcriptional regulator [Actinomycetota bacterium]